MASVIATPKLSCVKCVLEFVPFGVRCDDHSDATLRSERSVAAMTERKSSGMLQLRRL